MTTSAQNSYTPLRRRASAKPAMRRTWNLPCSTYDCQVVLRAQVPSSESRKRVPGTFLVSLVDRWIRALPETVYELAEALGEMKPFAPSASERERFHRRVRERLTQAFRSGELVAFEIRRPLGVAQFRKQAEEEKPQEPPEELTFAAIELVDEDGKPVAGQRYRLTCSDGSVREGRLNDKGFARVDDVPRGTCKVTFLGLDASSWE